MNAVRLTLVLALLLVGCSSVRQDVDSAAPFPRRFANYEALFNFICRREMLPEDAGTVFRLAADSEIDIWVLEGIPALYVVTPHYYAGGLYDQIRGAQGNGRYYLLRPVNEQFIDAGNLDRGFDLVGIAEGNTFRWVTINHVPRLITTWHMSAHESPTNTYDWNGKTFE